MAANPTPDAELHHALTKLNTVIPGTPTHDSLVQEVQKQAWALNVPKPQAGDGTGACHYTIDGQTFCCNLTEDQCKSLPNSSFDAGAHCTAAELLKASKAS
jgi:hypothetical protein